MKMIYLPDVLTRKECYIEEIMPDKIRMNMEFIENPGIIKSFKIIVRLWLEVLIQQKIFLPIKEIDLKIFT
jgi:hypothetical protein